MVKNIKSKNTTKSILPPLFTLVGSTVGAGVLALPYVFSRSGFGVGLLFLIAVYVMTLLLNLSYAEILLQVKGRHQLAGYAQKYFGKRGGMIAVIALLTGAYGALLAYIIQVGIFLSVLFPSIPSFYFSIIFFCIASFGVMGGVKLFSFLETSIVSVFLFLFLIVMVLGVSQIEMQHYLTIGQSFEDLLIPFGVLLFAFSGYSVIPELGEMTKYDSRTLKNVVFGGTSLVACVYLLFATIILGITGGNTSQDAITGLFSHFNVWIVRISIVVAVLSMSTAFVSLGHVLRDMFENDLGLNKRLGWLLAVIPALLLFLPGKAGFVHVLEVSGGITVGLSGVLLFLMYLMIAKKNKKEVYHILNLPRWIVYLVMFIFAGGIVYEVLRGLL